MKSKRFKWMAIVVVVVMAFSIFAGCNQISQAPTTEQEGNEAGEVGGHAETGGESSEGSGDSANPLAINETYDLTKNGVRAILSYDEQTNSFVGTVENVSDTIALLVLKPSRIIVYLNIYIMVNTYILRYAM